MASSIEPIRTADDTEDVLQLDRDQSREFVAMIEAAHKISSEGEQAAPFPSSPIQSSEIAHIDAIDYQVDEVRAPQIVDIQVGTSRIKNPG